MGVYCYLMGAKGCNYYKIGVSKDPEKRVFEVNTGFPIPGLRILASKKFESRNDAILKEKYYHHKYSVYSSNLEWFDIPFSQKIIIECFVKDKDFPDPCSEIKDKTPAMEVSQKRIENALSDLTLKPFLDVIEKRYHSSLLK